MKSTGTSGMNAVDWEARVDFDRLRTERLMRLKAQLEQSDVGAVLAFDFSNIRYASATQQDMNPKVGDAQLAANPACTLAFAVCGAMRQPRRWLSGGIWHCAAP